MSAFLGMRGTGDWATNERPENWRETILYLYPNGSAPLTAILAMMGSESTTDPVFHWWTKKLPEQGGDVTDVFDDAQFSSATSGAKSKGDIVYAQVSEETASHFRVGHTALLAKDGDHDYNYPGEVVGVEKNGSNSKVVIKLIVDTTAGEDIGDCDLIDVIGNANAEGAEMPASIGYDPVEYYNYTQIFRTPLQITRTARKTRLRTADAYQERKREALELHAIEMEKAFIWSERYSTIGANGKPKRYTDGIIPIIKREASDNVDDYRTNSDFSGKAWTASGGGKDWLDERLEIVFRHGMQEKLGLIGSGALLGIQKLAETHGQMNIQVGQAAYGIKVLEWILPFGTVYLKTHPLMSNRPHLRHDLLLLEPNKLKFRYVDDTFFVDDPQDQRNRNNSRDATEEEFITEGGLELHHPDTFGYLSGLGKDNS